MAEYMTINNNIIEAIYCGDVEENENIIILPENHEVRAGENIAFYNNDWSRKSDIELMQLGLIDIPTGFKLENNMLIEMAYVEKVIAGLEQLSSNMKIVDGQIVPKTAEELFAEMTLEEKENFIRSKRDALINEADILLLKYQEQVELGIVKIQRHEQEKLLGLNTTLSDDEFLKLLKYIQDLRDITLQEYFPDFVDYPEKI